MDNSTDQTIKRFKQVREENHFTQSDFAKVLNVKNSTADIERGKTKISGEVVTRLLEEFGINPLWLFGKSRQQLSWITDSQGVLFLPDKAGLRAFARHG